MFKVQVRGANGYVVEFNINKSLFTLGRDPASDVFLPSEQASRNHARIYVKGGDVFVEDLESSNGTFLRNEKVRLPTLVKENDPVKLGDVYVRVRYIRGAKKRNPGSSEYSVAQRLGNRNETTHIGPKDASHLRDILNGNTETGRPTIDPFKKKK